MERENVRQIPTEDLASWIIMSWFNKRHTNRSYYFELVRRFAYAAPVSVAVAANFLVDSSGAAGRNIVKGITS